MNLRSDQLPPRLLVALCLNAVTKQAFIIYGSLIFWVDEESVSGWAQSKQNKRVGHVGSAVTTALMVKRVRREIGLLLTLFLSWREKFVASLSPLVILFCGKYLF